MTGISKLNASGALPSEGGTYLLLLTLALAREIQVGRLGTIRFQRGWYAYSGSAFGPGGLGARVRRHLAPVRKQHWHLDYLRAETVAVEVWIAPGKPSREHIWAALLGEGGAAAAVDGFGCSDCRCRSHLFRLNRYPGKKWFMERLGKGVAVWRLKRGGIGSVGNTCEAKG